MKSLFVLLMLSVSWFSQGLEITFLNPATTTHPFWNQVTKITQYAADDFNLKLNVVYGRDNRLDNFAKLTEICAQQTKPDYLIFMPYTGNAFQSFQLLEEAKIKFFTLERSIPKTERERLGKPGEQFKYWLGEIYHDNVRAGEQLARLLLQKVLTKTTDNAVVTVFGITGDYSGESYDRSKGLVNVLSNHPTAKLKQIVHANWSPTEAIEKYQLLINRYGNANMVWTASDTMALAIADHINTTVPNAPRLEIGGFDWLPESIQAVEKNQLTATIGGHVFIGAWAIVRIFDHSNGLNNKGENLNSMYDMSVIHKENLSYYLPLFNDDYLNNINYRLLSLTLNQTQESYHFSAESLLDNMSK